MKSIDFSTVEAWVGIDWADKFHAIAYEGTMWPKERKRTSLMLPNKTKAIADFVVRLRKEFSIGLIAIVIEQARGGLIHHLMAYGFFVFFRVNPMAFSNYRKAFCASGAKGDPADADLLLDYVMKQPERFDAWFPEQARYRLFANLVEGRRVLVDKRTAITNHIKSKLKFYFPEVLKWIGNISSTQALDFLEKWPTLQSLQNAGQEEIKKFYLDHRCRAKKLLENRIKEIFEAQVLVSDEAIVLPAQISVQASAKLVRHLTEGIILYELEIEKIYNEHPDRNIYESFPGAGIIMQSRLAALMGLDRDRLASAGELRIYTGIAPITKASGNSRQVLFRYSAPKFLRQTLHEFAACSLPFTPWAKEVYNDQKRRKKKHHAAVRVVAFKWAAIIFACWKNRQPYDPKKAEQRRITSLKLDS